MATDSAQWDVLKLLNWTKDYFSRAHVDGPRLSAEMLLAHVLRCRRIDLYTRFAYLPAGDELTAYRELVKRGAAGEPVAYLVGAKEFYSLTFKVTPDVLIPRPETEILVAEAIDRLKAIGRAGRLWDVCTGSGCVAVAVASQVKDAEVLATDLSPAAVAIAQENAAANRVDARLRCRAADLLELPGDCPRFATVDVISANPPYVADRAAVAPQVNHEPAVALRAGPKGLDVIHRLVADAPARLDSGGALIMEFGHDQADAVRDLIVATGAFAEPRIIRDHQGIERSAVAIKK